MGLFAWLAERYIDTVTVPLRAVLALTCCAVVAVVCCVRCNASMNRNAWRMRNAHEGASEEGRSLLPASRVAAVVNQNRRDRARAGRW
jgi:hypothetical protein